MRSPLAYTPRSGPLQAASPPAAVAYLGSLVAVSFLCSSPLVLAAVGVAASMAGLLSGARVAVRAALRMGVALALLIVVINPLVAHGGQTVLARLGDWPWFGQVDVTAEALAEGAILGLRAAVAMVAFAVYSSCVDPDRVLRSLRPLAGRSALTATLISRLVPVASADAARLRDASRLRGPGAAEAGRAPLARRLLAGSLDRAVDVAATLELRGYSLEPPRQRPRRKVEQLRGSGQPQLLKFGSRFDRRFYLTAAAVLAAAIAGKSLGADDFHAYPTIHLGLGLPTVALSALLVLSGLAPLRRKPRRRAAAGVNGRPAGPRRPYNGRSRPVDPVMRTSPPRGPAAAPPPGPPGAISGLGATRA